MLEHKICKVCGREFVANSSLQMTCSKRCSKSMSNLIQKGVELCATTDDEPINRCPKDCKYRAKVGSMDYCDFLGINYYETGKNEIRGCEGGADCKRYVPVRNKRKRTYAQEYAFESSIYSN